MARWPAAIWQPVSTASGTLRPTGVTLHHQVGLGNPRAVYEARRVSAHFWIPYAGQPIQHVDTSVRAWHGGTEGLNGSCIGVETEGCHSSANNYSDPLNDHQLNLFAQLMQWANKTHGIPLRLSEVATDPGLNYHRCRGGFATACPCDVRLNARAEILRRAGAGTAPPAPTPPPPGAPPWPGEMLRQGSRGDNVRRYQQRMRDRGWRIGVDGIFGPESDRVTRQFQAEKRLGVDGIVGPVTWATAFRTDNVT